MKDIGKCEYTDIQFSYLTKNTELKLTLDESEVKYLVFVVEGSAVNIESAQKKYTVNVGECLILICGKDEKEYKFSGINTGFYQLRFKSEENFLKENHFNLYNTKNAEVLFDQILAHKRLSDYCKSGMDCLVKTALNEIVYQSSKHENRDVSLAQSIKKYIVSDARWRNISVKDVALHFGFCPDYISKIFYRYEKVPLKKYLNGVNVRKAEIYLEETDKSIKQIAENMGFYSTSAFCKFFKYHKGMTPGNYRINFKNKNK